MRNENHNYCRRPAAVYKGGGGVSRGKGYRLLFKTTDTRVIPELLSNETGIMIEEKNSQQLALAIKKLIENENIRKKSGEKVIKEHIKNIIFKKNTKKLSELFEYYS